MLRRVLVVMFAVTLLLPVLALGASARKADPFEAWFATGYYTYDEQGRVVESISINLRATEKDDIGPRYVEIFMANDEYYYEDGDYFHDFSYCWAGSISQKPKVVINGQGSRAQVRALLDPEGYDDCHVTVDLTWDGSHVTGTISGWGTYQIDVSDGMIGTNSGNFYTFRDEVQYH